MSAAHLESWLSEHRPALEASLSAQFRDAWPDDFGPALTYPLFTGGKRFRPAVVLASTAAIAPDPDDLSRAIWPAVAVELVHTYSLVHDDLPCMDDDDERRGHPTVHVAFGEPTAVLVGDALLTEAFAVLARSPFPATQRIDMVATLARASGYQGMVGGQAADIGTEGRSADLDTLHRLHAGKTGALMTAASILGGIAANATDMQLAQLRSFGECLGLAFQLTDDVLDADEDRSAGGPPSFVRLLGVQQTRERAQTLSQRAIQAVADLPRPEILQEIARKVVDREV